MLRFWFQDVYFNSTLLWIILYFQGPKHAVKVVANLSERFLNSKSLWACDSMNASATL